MGASISGGLPYQPWAAGSSRRTCRAGAKDDPLAGLCLPDPFLQRHWPCRISVVDPDAMAPLALKGYAPTTGRSSSTVVALPEDPGPGGRGTSVGRGERHAHVDSIGFRLTCGSISATAVRWQVPARSSPGHSAGLRSSQCPKATVDDPKAYCRPWGRPPPAADHRGQDHRRDLAKSEKFAAPARAVDEVDPPVWSCWTRYGGRGEHMANDSDVLAPRRARCNGGIARFQRRSAPPDQAGPHRRRIRPRRWKGDHGGGMHGRRLGSSVAPSAIGEPVRAVARRCRPRPRTMRRAPSRRTLPHRPIGRRRLANTARPINFSVSRCRRRGRDVRRSWAVAG